MFVGHYAVALALIALVPGVDPAVALVGVGLPDLLLAVLVLAGVETVSRDPQSPLWEDIAFVHAPYSHSLVVGGCLWTLASIPVAVAASPTAAVVLIVAAVSHWLLDVVVHDSDLPVLGVGTDEYVGLGLWRAPAVSFGVEILLYAAGTLLFVPEQLWPTVLAIGVAFHLVTVNASFGLARTNAVYDAIASRVAPRFRPTNPAVMRRLFALNVLVGYAGISTALWVVFGL